MPCRPGADPGRAGGYDPGPRPYRPARGRPAGRLVGPGEVTQEEVEDILCDHEGPVESSDSSGRPMVFGWTATGRRIAVVFTFEDDPDLIIVRPVTAYPVPEYGEGD